MIKLLEIWINKSKRERLVIYTRAQMPKYVVLGSVVILMYRNKSHSWIITKTTSWILIEHLIHKFQLLIENKLQLDSSIQNYLGFYENQISAKKDMANLTYVKNTESDQSYWIGYTYELESPVVQLCPSSWLYNNSFGDANLELSPIYPWKLDGYKSKKIIVKYATWIKNFKPYVVTSISQKNLQDGLLDLQQLFNVIQKNTKKWICRGVKYAKELEKEKARDRKKKRMAYDLFGYH